MRSGFWLIAAFVILLRLPFLNQAIQGDDVYYLAAAQHAQIDPAHPNSVRLIVLGDWVTMRGHPHPPLNGWILGGLIALLGDIREIPFHAAYILFSLIAAAAMWSLARRFTPRYFEATLLFCVTLPFVVNGNSLESDLPLLAFWMAGLALFIRAADGGRSILLAGAAAGLTLASLDAFQTVVAVPILWLYLWQHRRSSKALWLVSLTPVLVFGAWQLFERLTSESLPAAVLAGYFKTYNFQSIANKLRNAVALTAHAGWIVFPALTFAAFWSWPVALAGMAAGAFLDVHPLFWISFGAGVCLVFAQLRAWKADRDTQFLAAWIAVFFAASLVIFFAGSARYLLPMAAPVVILVSRRLSPKWLWGGAAAQLAIALMLAIVNYQQWGAYRDFARELQPDLASKRVWINSEWGFRYYLEAAGALPLQRGQAVQPGDLVVTSELALPIPFTTGGGMLAPYKQADIRSSLPLQIIGAQSKSAYSSTTLFGFRPFGISTSSIDRVRAETVVERKPELSYLPMNAPGAESQIVSGIYQLEAEKWRWMGERGSVLLKSPPAPQPLKAVFFIPDQSPARHATLIVDGRTVAEATYAGPGMQTLITAAPVTPSGPNTTVTLSIDKTFQVAGDHRHLGVILSEIGFR